MRHADPDTPRTPIHITGRPGPKDRPPLPPGHPITWGTLVAGTALEDACYPHPVYL